MLDARYQNFCQQALQFVAEHQIITDYIRTLAYGTDASFYRLVPKVIVKVDNEQQVIDVMALAQRLDLAICIRASGTSLSGQALTDSILITLSEHWKGYQITDNGNKITMQCGVLGSEANAALLAYQKMLALMPASIDAASIGGMAINNAAGMNSLDTYQMMDSARFVMLNGSVLDTADNNSRQQFQRQNPALIAGIEALAQRLRSDRALVARVQTKFQIKNTTGYGLRALLDFDDPIDIISHLMIGSEGTLGFISEITHNTIAIEPYKASAFLVFADIATAATVITRFKRHKTPVSAAELMDYRSMQAVADHPGVPPYLASLPSQSVALLVQVESDCQDGLHNKVAQVKGELQGITTVVTPEFSEDPEVVSAYWQVRKGIFPAVGAQRPAGTTTLIEDVAFPVEQLAEALVDLQTLMAQFDYHDGVIYGHALDGNLHFIFSQRFDSQEQRQRYQHFMTAICELVIDKYDGSLKAEHGTGRNMAPFVCQEWGQDAYQIMRDIKRLFDPKGLLNPDVMITDDPDIYLKNIKPMPVANELIDKCIECGFCERVCPSKNLTFTPRQRIVGQRELQILNVADKASFSARYDYLAKDTCAGCSLCSTVCPVGINTGQLIRQLRSQDNAKYHKRADAIARHFGWVESGVKTTLKLANAGHSVLGTKVMQACTDTARKLSGNALGKWLPEMPTAHKPLPAVKGQQHEDKPLKVVYFPSCASRSMGPAKQAKEQDSLFDTTVSLLHTAGFEVLCLDDVSELCCGMPFESKGMFSQSEDKAEQLTKALTILSEQGKYPILFDTSPCTMKLSAFIKANNQTLDVYDPVSFIHDHLMTKVEFVKTDEPIAFHLTCSARNMGLEHKTKHVLSALSNNVMYPEHITCCGWAGDKGFTVPELNASALKTLKPQVANCTAGFSTSRTCEIGLSHHSGIDYQSIIYLASKCAVAKI